MEGCKHLAEVKEFALNVKRECEDCMKVGGIWVHLRMCMICGHVRCCDNSPGRHATKHFHASTHPIIRSFEPGENWGYCYPDDMFYEELPQAE